VSSADRQEIPDYGPYTEITVLKNMDMVDYLEDGRPHRLDIVDAPSDLQAWIIHQMGRI
jgi:hypothetical protein